MQMIIVPDQFLNDERNKRKSLEINRLRVESEHIMDELNDKIREMPGVFADDKTVTLLAAFYSKGAYVSKAIFHQTDKTVFTSFELFKTLIEVTVKSMCLFYKTDGHINKLVGENFWICMVSQEAIENPIECIDSVHAIQRLIDNGVLPGGSNISRILQGITNLDTGMMFEYLDCTAESELETHIYTQLRSDYILSSKLSAKTIPSQLSMNILAEQMKCVDTTVCIEYLTSHAIEYLYLLEMKLIQYLTLYSAEFSSYGFRISRKHYQFLSLDAQLSV